MNLNIKRTSRQSAILLMACLNQGLAQQPTAQERAVALKASLAASQALLKPYEWVETTVVSLKGEEKTRQMNRCYNGADGKVQKIPLTVTRAGPEEKEAARQDRRGQERGPGRLHEGGGGARQAVRPTRPGQNPGRQGRLASSRVTPLPPQRARLTFTDYLKAGDSLAIEVDLGSNRPLEAKVSSYLDSLKEPVTMDVKFGTLDNSATYVASTLLKLPSKDLTVDVQNSGYHLGGK